MGQLWTLKSDGHELLQPVSPVALGKSLNLSGPRLPYRQHRSDYITPCYPEDLTR